MTFAILDGVFVFSAGRDRWRVYTKRGRRIGGTWPTAERAVKAYRYRR